MSGLDQTEIYQNWFGKKYIRIGLERNISGLDWKEIYREGVGMKYIKIGLE